MAGKYTPLEHFLRDLPNTQQDITLPFEVVERILNDKLPKSAYQYQAWWANESKPHQPEKLAILNAGWRVMTVNFLGKWVRLIRIKKTII